MPFVRNFCNNRFQTNCGQLELYDRVHYPPERTHRCWAIWSLYIHRSGQEAVHSSDLWKMMCLDRPVEPNGA